MTATDNATLQQDGVAAAPRRPSDRKTRRRRTILIAIILILLLSLCVIAAVILRIIMPSSAEVADRDDAGGIEWVRSIYGWGPGASETFVRPIKVEVGDGGAIYVSDQQYSFVSQFDPEGQLTRFIGENAEPSLFRVGSIAEGDGQFFFAQSSQDVVRVFTEEGQSESEFEFPSPNDVEFSGDRLAVASNFGVVVFDAAGELLWEYGGERGDGPDQFDNISGLAWGPDGTLYVCDSYNNRISAFDEDGNRLWMVVTGAPSKGVDIRRPAEIFARETTSPADLAMPVDCVVDGNNRLVVVDGLDFSISVFDADDGAFIRKYGAFGTKEGQLAYPTSIDYDSDRDWFVVADGGNRRVQILRLEDSASGAGSLIGAARRAFSGPLRACLFPLLLLLVMGIVWFVLNKRRKDAQRQELASESNEANGESALQAGELDDGADEYSAPGPDNE